MKINLFIVIMVTIAILSIIATILLAIKKRNKYIPSIVVLIGSIIFCVIMPMPHGCYINIMAYIIVFIITIPAILLSLITAFIFNTVQSFIGRTKK